MKIKIAVHNGSYHADDCMAYAILSYIFPNNELLRTRDPEELASCNYVVDVGGKYDQEKYFDHHQREFKEVRPDHDHIKYASAGLIWKHFGEKYIQKAEPTLNSEQIQKIKAEVDYKLIRYIDANDNGITLYDDQIPNISKAVYMFNQSLGYLEQKSFMQASSFLGIVLNGYVVSEFNYIESEKVVLEALKNIKDPRILVITKKIGFNDVINQNWDLFSKTQIVVYHNQSEDVWRVQSVQADPNDRFSTRCPAPEKWRGLRDQELDEAVGVKDLTFVHPNGFTGGARTEEAVMALAQKWVELAQ